MSHCLILKRLRSGAGCISVGFLRLCFVPGVAVAVMTLCVDHGSDQLDLASGGVPAEVNVEFVAVFPLTTAAPRQLWCQCVCCNCSSSMGSAVRGNLDALCGCCVLRGERRGRSGERQGGGTWKRNKAHYVGEARDRERSSLLREDMRLAATS